MYPRLDSAVWSASGVPAPDTVLAFDPDDGSVAFIDMKGRPRRLDLRASEVRTASTTALSSLASANGSDIYGVTAKGTVSRMTPAGDWTFEPPSPAKWVFPQANRTVIIAGASRTGIALWLIRPTDDEIIETASLPGVTAGARAQAGDRLYFTAGSGLAGVRTRDLTPVRGVKFPGSVTALAATPSGDRLYVALAGTAALEVIDRYSESVSGRVALPGPASALRMDPLGQFILARPAAGGDSAWVIAVGTNRVEGSIQTRWKPDLPAFAPGSTIATARGNDVVFLDAGSLEAARTVTGGASDFWFFFTWNGFRPRSAGLDRPVTFDSPVIPARPDSALTTGGDSMPAPPLRDASPTMVNPPPTVTPQTAGYMVSFAAVLSEQKAGETAAGMTVNGMRPRVMATPSGSTTIYRVVLGPFGTREEAERVGRDSRRQYWVYEASR